MIHQEQLPAAEIQAKAATAQAGKEGSVSSFESTTRPEPKPEPKSRKRANVKEDTLRIMHQNLGLHMTIAEVASQSNYNQKQVGQALSSAAKHGLLRRVASAVYVYNPADSSNQSIQMPTNNLFEAVGTLDNGTPVVRGEDGQLLVLQTLEAYYRANIRVE